MNRQTSVAVGIVLVAVAIILGLLLLNKGDGPVAGMILSDRALVNTDQYNAAAKAPGDGIYLVASKEYNKFRNKYLSGIPEAKELFATFYFVECPVGTEFTVRWLKEDELIKEAKKTLVTNTKGVISYILEGAYLEKGSYSIELYDGNIKLIEKEFHVK